MVRLAHEGLTEDCAFRKPNMTRAKVVGYKDNIFTKLEEIQQTTNLIDPAYEIWNDYGVQRFRRR